MIDNQKVGTAELLYRRARQMGLQPSWVIQDGLFAVRTPRGERYINFTRSPLNPQVGASLANNKYLARLVMERHQLPNIPFARPQTAAQAQAFLDEHGTIVVKPVNGAGSRDIHIVRTMAELAGLDIAAYIFEKYIAGKELRYLVLNGTVIGVHESEYGTSVEATRALQRISYPAQEWDPQLVALSLRIAEVIGLAFAAVDFLIDNTGAAHILEVNSTPGLKWFHAPTSGPPIDVARLFLQAMFADVAAPASASA